MSERKIITWLQWACGFSLRVCPTSILRLCVGVEDDHNKARKSPFQGTRKLISWLHCDSSLVWQLTVTDTQSQCSVANIIQCISCTPVGVSATVYLVTRLMVLNITNILTSRSKRYVIMVTGKGAPAVSLPESQSETKNVFSLITLIGIFCK